MRPREIPLVLAIGGSAWASLQLDRCEKLHCGVPETPLAWLPPLLSLAMLGTVALLGVLQWRRLRIHVTGEITVAGEAYRDVQTRRQVPAFVARDWRRRVGWTALSSLLVAGTLSVARPSPPWTLVVIASMTAGAAAFLRFRWGRASSLYLPLMLSLLQLTRESFRVAALPCVLTLACVLLAQLEPWSEQPLGGYEREEPNAHGQDAPRGTWAWTLVWSVLLFVPSALFVSLPKFCCSSPIKESQYAARSIGTAALLWRASRNTEACPSLQQLIADKELLADDRTVDYCGQPFRIACEGDDVRVRSAGLDRVFGTADDLVIRREQ